MIDREYVYELLLAQHGPQNWWPSDSPFEMMVGAVLVQRTKWRNVERAIEKLRSSGLLDPKRMRTQSVERLTTYIHSCGFFQTKARQLNALCAYFSRHDDDVSRMRDISSTLREEL